MSVDSRSWLRASVRRWSTVLVQKGPSVLAHHEGARCILALDWLPARHRVGRRKLLYLCLLDLLGAH